jgi:iron complex outermembrane receptor protein
VDFGARTSKQFLFGSRYIVDLGADYFGRRSVDSNESQTNEPLHSLKDGEEDELGLTATLSVQLRRVVLEGGARFTWFGQDNLQSGRISDTALNGFAGVSVPLKLGIEVTGSVGSGLRFPTLSERFFQGTTGRGVVVGNPLLESERSINTDLGIRLDSPKIFASGYYFYNRISDYVERVELKDDFYTFLNLTRGAIQGFEWETALALQEKTSLYFRGHFLTGEDDRGTPLSDIPVHRFAVGFRREETKVLTHGAEWQFRGRKNNPGSGEQKIDSANLLSAFLGFRLIPSVHASVAISNVLNDLYHPTADRKAAFAPGRSIAISVNWLPD